MMNLYTLTTQYANNIGALLQCYALSHYLSSQDGVTCQVIDYWPKDSHRSWEIVPHPRNWKEAIKNIIRALNIRFILEKKKKIKLMKSFIKKYIPLTPLKYNHAMLHSHPPIGNAYICGSDQIWNFTIFDDMSYYFDFVDNVPGAKRISYAASIADSWNEKQQQKVSKYLKKFTAISIREKGNMLCLNNALGNQKKAEWVIDPVFLLDTKDWDHIARNPNKNEPYILCYFLNVDSFAVKVIHKIRKETRLKVINLGLDVIDKINSDEFIRVYDPCDFIGYIKNATYIFTNSFHCSAFSTIYHKNFCFIPKSWANERILSLQEIFKYNVVMNRERFNDLKAADLTIDYSIGDESGREFIEQSKQFLLNAISD